MPRGPRRDHPLARHHVMVRGIERRALFLDDEDRSRFLWRLARVLALTDARCHAFAIMPNHFHLLVEVRGTPLSRVMLRLGTGHALDFNRRHRRVGHLYQNRFKSKLLETDDSYRNVIRYVHLNPVAARIVPDLEALARWPWTGHAALLGNLPAPFLDARAVLRHFGDGDAEARRVYAAWMAQAEGPDPETSDPTGSPPVQGTLADFVDPVRLDPRDDQDAIRRAGWDLDRVIGLVCLRVGVGESALRAGGRTAAVRRARAEVALVGVHGLGLAQVKIARATGVTPQAISKALVHSGGAREETLLRYPELMAKSGSDRHDL